ncbi:hypothetical protein [Nesterenkonia sp.]|uniref:hypothetical protein n=1 Tax=Nesterenkonia sp. TaxID=704201 RepID=UPI002608FD10|nr:hypothetical protein [Nesterenkonia sp.]
MNQRRRHSPAVYRRRRLVAALLAVFVLALAAWGVRALIDTFTGQDEAPAAAPQQSAEDHDDAGTAASSSAEESPAEEPEETPAGEDAEAQTEAPAEEDEDSESDGRCAPSDIEVRASTNQESYGTDVAPLLIMEIENTGSQECTLDVGTAEQVFRVSSGSREIFNTDQCGLSGESLEMEFEPGQTESAHLVWPRSDSSVDCTEAAELVTGEYQLIVSVSGISSEPHTFEVLGVEP